MQKFSLHEMSEPIFWEKIVKSIINLLSVQLAHIVVKAKGNGYTVKRGNSVIFFFIGKGNYCESSLQQQHLFPKILPLN